MTRTITNKFGIFTYSALLLVMSILLLSNAGQAYVEGDWTSGGGDNEMLFLFDDTILKTCEQPWLIGSFDKEGNYDGLYSVDFVPMRDDGLEGDQTPGDHIWSLKYSFNDTDQEFSALVYRDRSSKKSQDAIDIKSFKVDSRKLRLSSVRRDVAIINIKTDKTVRDLYISGSWDAKGAYTEDAFSPPIKARPMSTSDGGIIDGLWQTDPVLEIYPVQHTIKLMETESGTPFATVKGIVNDSKEMYISTYNDELVDVTITFNDYTSPPYEQLYIIGSWDAFGDYDDLYTSSLQPMEFNFEEGLNASPRVWTYKAKVSPDERSYSVLFFDSTKTINSRFAIEIRSFYAMPGEPVSLEVTVPRPTATKSMENVGIPRDDVYLIAVFVAAGIIIFVVFFFSLKNIFFPQKTSFGHLLVQLRKKRILVLACEDRDDMESVVVSALRDWLSNHALVCGLFTSHFELENLKERITKVVGDDKWLKKWGENLLVHEDKSLNAQILDAETSKLSELDLIVVDSMETYSLQETKEENAKDKEHNNKQNKGSKNKQDKDQKKNQNKTDSGKKDFVSVINELKAFYSQYSLPCVLLVKPSEIGIEPDKELDVSKIEGYKDMEADVIFSLIRKADKSIYSESRLDLSAETEIDTINLITNKESGRTEEAF